MHTKANQDRRGTKTESSLDNVQQDIFRNKRRQKKKHLKPMAASTQQLIL